MARDKIAGTGMPVWSDAEDFCALADSDRHLGHIVNAGEWEAFDAIHPNDAGNGFRYLGAFPTVSSAKVAVERAVVQSMDEMTKSAGSGMWVS
jgi:hypothetical protein